MKSFYLILFISLSSLFANAQALSWGNPIVIDQGNDVNRPRIGILKNNAVVIVYSIGDVLYSKTGNSQVFNTSAIVSNAARSNHMEGPAMANSGDTVYVVYEETGNSSDVFMARSFNGGGTYENSLKLNPPGNINILPAVAVSDGGNPIIAYLQSNPNASLPRYIVRRSEDAGQTFSAEINASQQISGNVCECCPAWIVTKGDFLSLLYRNNNQNIRDIWTEISGDKGNSFTRFKDIDNTNWFINACPSTGPEAILSGDSLISVWMSKNNGRVQLNSLNINDLEIGTSSELAPITGSSNQFYPAIAGSENIIGIVWEDTRTGNSKIHFTWSVNGAAGPFHNFEFPGSGNQESSPDISFTNGVFHFTFKQDNKIIYRTASIVGTNTKEFGINSGSQLYPNPFSGNCSLSFNNPDHSPVNIILSDIRGMKVKEYASTGSQQIIQKENLRPGIYFITIQRFEQTETLKLIIQ